MENVKKQILPRTPEDGHDFKGPVTLILSVVAPTLFSSMDLLEDPNPEPFLSSPFRISRTRFILSVVGL